MAKPQSMQQHRERMLAEKAARLNRSPDPRRVAIVGAGIANTAMAMAQALQPAADAAVQSGIELGSTHSPVQNIELRLSSQMTQLKSVKSIQTKEALKAEWLPEYHGYIEGTLANPAAGQNNALIHLMVWAIDAGDYSLAIRIGQYGILNDMVMPEPYSRSIAEVLAETCAERFKTDSAVAVAHTEQIQLLLEVVRGSDMVDQVYAKLYKVLGMALNDSKPVEALNAYKIALRLDSNVGVKKAIETLERQLKKGNATESHSDAPSGSQDAPTAASAAVVADPASTASTDPAAPAESSPTESGVDGA